MGADPRKANDGSTLPWEVYGEEGRATIEAAGGPLQACEMGAAWRAWARTSGFGALPYRREHSPHGLWGTVPLITRLEQQTSDNLRTQPRHHRSPTISSCFLRLHTKGHGIAVLREHLYVVLVLLVL